MRKVSYEEWRNGVEQYRAFSVPSDVARISLEAVFRWLNRDLAKTAPANSDDNQPGKQPMRASLPECAC